jgi:hypothetical protein
MIKSPFAATKVILILRCADCGQELNRTPPLTREEANTARVFSAMAAGRCPNGCRSTFSDLNINTRVEEFPVEEQ